VWRVHPRGIVNAILMVVGCVCSKQPVETAFVQRDDVVEQLAPAAAHPALGDAVLPAAWIPVRVGSRPVAFRNAITPPSNRRVVVEKDETMWTVSRKHLAQLLHHPGGRWLAGHIEVQNRASMVFDNEEA
jgi:hypothetical protein